MNSVVLIGRLTRDPEMSFTQSQTAKTTFSLAVDRPKRGGEDQGADFIRIVVWGKQAESCDRYLRKGSMCAVKGSIRTGSYENKIGVKVYTTDVWADRVKFLDTRPVTTESFERTDDFLDDEIPFSAADDDIPF